MDTDAFFGRIKARVVELEAVGKRIPPDIKKTIRQRPTRGYRLDSLERLAEALDWSVHELLAGIWQTSEFSPDSMPAGLRRHAVCLHFARKTFVRNALYSPELNERELEDRVAELYQLWLRLEKSVGHPINAEAIVDMFEAIEREATQRAEEMRAAEASHPPSEQPEGPAAPEKKAASDDGPPLAA